MASRLAAAMHRQNRWLRGNIEALKEDRQGMESAIRAAALLTELTEDYDIQLQKASEGGSEHGPMDLTFGASRSETSSTIMAMSSRPL